jgi:hypothetical protein
MSQQSSLHNNHNFGKSQNSQSQELRSALDRGRIAPGDAARFHHRLQDGGVSIRLFESNFWSKRFRDKEDFFCLSLEYMKLIRVSKV